VDTAVDVYIEDHGSLTVFALETADAKAWFAEHVETESHNMVGEHGVAVEVRYAGPIIEGLVEAGFVVRAD
jgi:hypothetical protein